MPEKLAANGGVKKKQPELEAGAKALIFVFSPPTAFTVVLSMVVVKARKSPF